MSAVVVAALLLTGCATDATATSPSPSAVSTAPSPAPTTTSVPTGLPLRVAVVGDSNTTGFLPSLDEGITARMSWIALVPASDLVFAGGWARNGATSTDMRGNVAPVADADVAVIMAGTNNLAFGLAREVLDDDLVAIAGTVGARHTVIAGIAPWDFDPAAAVELNTHLASLAAANGWTFVDPWTALRAPDGTWVAEYYTDGIHTDQAGYQVMATAIAEALVAQFG